MTQLPTHEWWRQMRFTTGHTQPGSSGFSMSRDEMFELLRLARNMQDQIKEQWEAMRPMREVSAPANDPGSQMYLGSEENWGALGAFGNANSNPSGARYAAQKYRHMLGDQYNYLERLIEKLSEALRTVERVDTDSSESVDHLNRFV